MDYIKDFFASIFEQAKTRLSSPFVGSFLTSFALWNWRPISIYLFSTKSIEEKIKAIDAGYINVTTFLPPLILTLFYIVALPYLNIGLDRLVSYATVRKYKQKNNKEINDWQHKVTIADYEYKVSYTVAGKKDIDELNNKILTITQELEVKKQETTQLNFEKTNLQKEYLNSQSLLTEAIEKTDSFRTTLEILADRNYDRRVNYIRKNLTMGESESLKKAINGFGLLDKEALSSDLMLLLEKMGILDYNPENSSFYISNENKETLKTILK